MTDDPFRPLRVAHVIQNLNYGGMERVLHDLAGGLSSRGFDVHIVVLQYLGRFANGLENAVSFHQIGKMSRRSFLRPQLLTDKLRQIDPAVVHSHSGVWYRSAVAARAAKVSAVVHTEHGRPDPVPLSDRLIDNLASRRTDAVVAVSEPLATTLRRQVVHDASRLSVIANGVNTDRFQPSTCAPALKRELGIPADALVVGSVGRLEPVKNYRMALQAFARLDAGFDGGRQPWLVLVGDGNERMDLEKTATELGVAARVRFLGWRSDAEKIYGAFDVFMLSSRSEGTSVSLLEAMSSGLCPVVTDVGGNRAVLGPELAARVVPDNDEIAMAREWRRQLESPGSRKRIGLLARERVQHLFSVSRMIDEYAELYRALVARAGQKANPLVGTGLRKS